MYITDICETGRGLWYVHELLTMQLRANEKRYTKLTDEIVDASFSG